MNCLWDLKKIYSTVAAAISLKLKKSKSANPTFFV